MYTIANIFTWILAILATLGIVVTSFAIAKIITPVAHPENLGVGTLVYLIIVLIVALVTIALVRKAKSDNSSKGWDVLFIVLGVLGGNVFYILGGIFGLVAKR